MSQNSSQVSIRPVQPTRGSGLNPDEQQILSIYNHYILHSPATFDTEPYTATTRAPWFAQFDDERYFCLVAAQGADKSVKLSANKSGQQAQQIIGYANSARFRPKAAYDTSVEVSVYLHPDHLGQGLGAALYAALLNKLAERNVHRCYAGITLPNPSSVGLHEKFGFHQVGLFSEVGYKFSRYWDVAWLQHDMQNL